MNLYFKLLEMFIDYSLFLGVGNLLKYARERETDTQGQTDRQRLFAFNYIVYHSKECLFFLLFSEVLSWSIFIISDGGNTLLDINYTATCLLSRKLSKLDEPDTAGEEGTSS